MAPFGRAGAVAFLIGNLISNRALRAKEGFLSLWSPYVMSLIFYLSLSV